MALITYEVTGKNTAESGIYDPGSGHEILYDNLITGDHVSQDIKRILPVYREIGLKMGNSQTILRFDEMRRCGLDVNIRLQLG